jgi:hypothetical protein
MATLEELEQKQQELQFKQEELLEQQKELARQIKELKEKDNKQKKWQPKKDEVYYFVSGDGDVEKCPHRNSFYDRWRIPQGNCFKTEREARQHLENLKTKIELRHLADELNGDRVIDWEHYNPTKYSIIYDYGLKTISLGTNATARDAGVIYCLDENFADIAEQRIGEQRLINMIISEV